MKKNQQKISLRPYYTLGFPLLGLMSLVALAGVALTVVLHFV
jgi:hypothetical protein